MHILKQGVTEELDDGLLLLGVGSVDGEVGRRLALQAAALPIDGPCVKASCTQGAREAANISK